MKLIDVQKKLLALKQPILRTNDAAACLEIKPSHASKILERLNEAGVLKKIVRGLWMFSDTIDPLYLPEAITNPFPSYISLQTALYFHGFISQIPETTYAISLGRTKKYRTPLGLISIHHLNSDLFFGYENIDNTSIKIAIPEKALFDILYLSQVRSLLFKRLPEVEISKEFKTKKLLEMIQKVSSKRLRTIMKDQLEKIL